MEAVEGWAALVALVEEAGALNARSRNNLSLRELIMCRQRRCRPSSSIHPTMQPPAQAEHRLSSSWGQQPSGPASGPRQQQQQQQRSARQRAAQMK